MKMETSRPVKSPSSSTCTSAYSQVAVPTHRTWQLLWRTWPLRMLRMSLGRPLWWLAACTAGSEAAAGHRSRHQALRTAQAAIKGGYWRGCNCQLGGRGCTESWVEGEKTRSGLGTLYNTGQDSRMSYQHSFPWAARSGPDESVTRSLRVFADTSQ